MEEWYVLQTQSGAEEITKDLCCSIIDDGCITECFIPRYERMKRYEGSWHTENYILFPGYLFIITTNVIELCDKLRSIPRFTRLLGVDDEALLPLTCDEVNFIEQTCGTGRIVQMSQGYQEGTEVIVTDGPMKNFNGHIKHVDRHKRLATLEISFFGRLMDVQMGLELIQKAAVPQAAAPQAAT